VEEKEQEEPVPDPRVSNVCVGTLGQAGWYRSKCAFVKAKGCQIRETKYESVCPQGHVGEGRKRAEDSKALPVDMCCVPEDREAVWRQ